MDHSFIVLAYGDSPFLPGCLESLGTQTAGGRIVVATSTPSAYVADAARAAGVELMINPERAGIAADWNFALRQATTRYVTLAHQDDLYEPVFATRSLDLLRAHSEAVLCFTSYQEIDDDGRATHSKISRVKHLIEAVTLGRRETVSGRPLKAFLAFGNPLPCSSVTFDRERLSAFVFSDRYQSNLDWEAWLRLATAGAVFVRAPERLVGRRHNALTATSRLIASGARAAEDLELFRMVWPPALARAIATLYRASYS